MKKPLELYRLIWLSRPLMQAAEARVERGLDGTDLTVRMRAILEVLYNHGSATVPDIATKLEIKRQYVQLMINETLGGGLTVRLPNPRHRTSTMIALTPKGRALISDVMSRELRFVEQLGADIDTADISTALRVVGMLVERLKGCAEEPSA